MKLNDLTDEKLNKLTDLEIDALVAEIAMGFVWKNSRGGLGCRFLAPPTWLAEDATNPPGRTHFLSEYDPTQPLCGDWKREVPKFCTSGDAMLKLVIHMRDVHKKRWRVDYGWHTQPGACVHFDQDFCADQNPPPMGNTYHDNICRATAIAAIRCLSGHTAECKVIKDNDGKCDCGAE